MHYIGDLRANYCDGRSTAFSWDKIVVYIKRDKVVFTRLFNKRDLLLFIFTCTSLIFISGCTTISPESIELTTQLSGMIKSAKTAHLNLAHEFIVQQHKRVDDYISSISSEYMRLFYNKPKVKQALEKDYQTSEEKQAVMAQTAEAAAIGLYEMKRELLAPLDLLEKTMNTRIANYYDDMSLVSQTLLVHLKSAQSSSELRDKAIALSKDVQKNLIPLDDIAGRLDSLFNNAKGKYADITSITSSINALVQDIGK